MATSAGEVEVTLTLKQGDFNRMLGQTKDELQSFGDQAGSIISEHALAITAALTAIVAYAKKAVDAYAEQELATSKLVRALENQGIASNSVVQHLAEQARALEQLTGVQDNELTSAQALIATFGITGNKMDETLKAAVDLSAGMGIDLNSAVMLLGKAFEGHITTLARYGIQVNKNIDPTLRFSTVLGEVNSRFGGTAAAQAATFGGQLKLLADAFEHLNEAVGKIIAGEAGGLVKWFTDLVKKITDSIEVIGNARMQFNSFFDFLKTYAISLLGTIVLTITGLIQKVFEMESHIPIVGRLYAALATAMKTTNGWIEDQIVKLQAAKLMSADTVAVMTTNEQTKQVEYHNTATVYKAQLDQTGKYVKDKLAEEMKVRSEQAAALKTAHEDFAKSFVTTSADMWNEASSLANSFTSGVGHGFAKMVMEGKKFGDSMKELFQDIAQEIIAWIIKMIIKMLIFLALREAAQHFGPVGMAVSSAMGLAQNSGLTGMASGGMIREPSIITGLRTGQQSIVGEAGPEAITPASMAGGGGGGDGGVTVNITGQFIEGDPASWQKLINEKIVPAIRRFTMATPTGPFTRRRGVA